MLSLEKIREAQQRIRGLVRRTPLEYSSYLSQLSGCPCYLKLENWQVTGSFKPRGATNKLLSLTSEEKRRGIITASAGNHALGVAYAAKREGIRVKIVLPVNVSAAKLFLLKQYEVEIVKAGRDYDEAEEEAYRIADREGLTFVHPFNDPEVMAGQGSIGLEIEEELPQVEMVLVPVGGGGLISGVGAALKGLKPGVEVVGVQSVASPAMYRSWQAGKPTETPIEPTIADGLAGRLVSEIALEFSQKYADRVVLVSEESIAQAIYLLLKTNKILVEGAGAVGVAALISRVVDPAGKRVVALLSGSNINLHLLKALLQQGEEKGW